MIFLIDEDVPRSTANIIKGLIKGLGYQVFDVRDIGLRGASDKKILAKAIDNSMVIVTADVGFAGLPISL